MKFSENSDYGFVIGRVRAKETFLIKRNEYERLISTRSESELLSNVKAIWCLESTEKETANFDNLLQAAHKENTDFFTKYCLDQSVKQLLLNSTAVKDKAMPDYLENLSNEFLTLYFTVVIDLENIRSFIRIKNLAVKEKQDIATQKKMFSNIFLSNGTIKESALSDLFVETWEELIHWCASTPYQSCIEEGVVYLINRQSFLRLERLIQEYKQKILIQTRYATFGYEPLVAYYLLKDMEIRNLRKIYYGIMEKTLVDQIWESVACILK
jgi:vacuolar-type H+-ATPase subunit C/Vma6